MDFAMSRGHLRWLVTNWRWTHWSTRWASVWIRDIAFERGGRIQRALGFWIYLMGCRWMWGSQRHRIFFAVDIWQTSKKFQHLRFRLNNLTKAGWWKLQSIETLQYSIHVVAISHLYIIAKHDTLAIQSDVNLNPFHIHAQPFDSVDARGVCQPKKMTTNKP